MLEELIEKFCEIRTSSLYSKMYTVIGYAGRLLSFGKFRKRVWREITSEDISTSTRLKSLVETACEKSSIEQLNKSKLDLKLHISSLTNRNLYLVFLGALIASALVLFRLTDNIDLAIGTALIFPSLIMLERSKIAERKHQLEELLMYLECEIESRKESDELF